MFKLSWSVQNIIRRGLVYGVVIGILAGIYFGSTVLLQTLLSYLTGGQQHQLVIVVSTLVVAGLFNPLRRRLQPVIDRLFYRRNYEAAQAVAAFGASLRDEVDLERLSERLLAVVEDLAQPEHVSLWLCQVKGKE